MKFRETSCCAWSEISNLSSHLSPEIAMKVFCESNLSDAGGRVNYHGMPSTQNKLYSFYLFSAAVCTPGGKDSYLPQFGTDYGSKFAKFILDNKLGEIVESGIRPNQAYHSDHSNVIWIWSPNQANIEAWWGKAKTKFAKEAEEQTKLKTEQAKIFAQRNYPAGVKVPVAKLANVAGNGMYQQIYYNNVVQDDGYKLPDLWEEV